MSMPAEVLAAEHFWRRSKLSIRDTNLHLESRDEGTATIKTTISKWQEVVKARVNMLRLLLAKPAMQDEVLHRWACPQNTIKEHSSAHWLRCLFLPSSGSCSSSGSRIRLRSRGTVAVAVVVVAMSVACVRSSRGGDPCAASWGTQRDVSRLWSCVSEVECFLPGSSKVGAIELMLHVCQNSNS